MTVLDAQAVVALLLDERGADRVVGLIQREAAISAVNVAEVIDVIARGHKRDADEVVQRIDWLVAGGLVVVPVTDDVARAAGALRSREYHRSRNPLSLADCVALATAMSRGEPLATADRPLAETARRNRVRVVSLNR